jgi:hypothetical protein
MIGSIAIVLIAVAPALLFLGWLTLLGVVVSALGASSDMELDELHLLKPSTRPT